MKQSTKILAILIVSLLAFSVFGIIPASADTEGAYTYVELEDGTVEITRYDGSDVNLVIPSTLGGKTVSSIGNEAFYSAFKTPAPSGNKTIVSVTIPGTIKRIGDNAFFKANALQSVVMEEGVEIIGESVFQNCNKLTNISFPSSIVQIGYLAFYCSPAQKAAWENNLMNTYQGEYYVGSVLYKFFGAVPEDYVLNIREGTKTIAAEFLYEDYTEKLENLIEVIVPASVEVIDYAAFRGCSGLKTVRLQEGLKEIRGSVFSECSSLENIILPKTLSVLGSGAFNGCSSLKSIDIPYGVESIGEMTFISCTSLMSITLPESLKIIDDYAFSDCLSLLELTIPASVETLGIKVFGYDYNGKLINKPLKLNVYPGSIGEQFATELASEYADSGLDLALSVDVILPPPVPEKTMWEKFVDWLRIVFDFIIEIFTITS